jgi:hypothetical protein
MRETVREPFGADVGRPVEADNAGNLLWQLREGAADELDVVRCSRGFELK